MTNSALKQDGESDYTLESESVWITVKGFSVYLKKTDEGLVVDVHAAGRENEDSIAGTYAYDSELIEEIEND